MALRDGHRPVEALDEGGEERRHRHHGEAHAWAGAAAAPEGDELHVLALGVDGGGGAARHEALRAELEGLLPRARVAADGEDVEEDGGLGRDGVAADVHGLDGLPLREHGRRLQAQGLLEDGLQVGEPRDVVLADEPRAADGVVQLGAQPVEARRVVDEVRQHPLHAGGGGVGPSGEDVLRLSC